MYVSYETFLFIPIVYSDKQWFKRDNIEVKRIEDGYCAKCKGTKVLLKNGMRYCGRKGCRELLVISPVYKPIKIPGERYLLKKLKFCIDNYLTQGEVEEFGILEVGIAYGVQFPEKLHGIIKIDMSYERKRYLQALSLDL